MEWDYVCRGCGQIIASFDTLNAANEHSFCKTCLKNRDADLSDFVAIGFTVSKAVRKSRFHDPETLSAKEFYINYNISADALARDGTKARDFYWRHKVFLHLCGTQPNQDVQDRPRAWIFSLSVRAGACCRSLVG